MNVVDIDKAIAYINDGAVGVMLTDTVYGLACQATDMTAVQRLYDLKQRSDKPGTVLVASADQALSLGILSESLERAQQLWPGPISVVMSCASDKLAYLHLGKQSLAVRLPDNDKLRSLLEQTGPLLTSSANLPGKPPATNSAEAFMYFGDSVDFYLDDDIGSLHKPSTIVQVVDDTVVVLRQGAVILNEHGGLL